MTPESVIDVMGRAIVVVLEAAGPLLALGIGVGLLMGLVQAATQLSEPSLTFVPKMLALGAALMLFGGWIIERLTSFSREMLEAIGRIP